MDIITPENFNTPLVPTFVNIPVLKPLETDSVTAALKGCTLQPMGVPGVDSGQMMILDAGAEEHFVDNRPDFAEDNDSLSYAGACSTTTRRSHYGGVLSHQGTPCAGVSSSGYGDGAYPAYVTDKTDAVLVSFMLHEVADIDADEETVDEAVDAVNDESELDTEVLVRNAERLTWIDGGTFVVEDAPGGADVIIGDPCYMKDGHADMSLMTRRASGDLPAQPRREPLRRGRQQLGRRPRLHHARPPTRLSKSSP